MSEWDRLGAGLLAILLLVLALLLGDPPKRSVPSCALSTPTRAHPAECREP